MPSLTMSELPEIPQQKEKFDGSNNGKNEYNSDNAQSIDKNRTKGQKTTCAKQE